MPNPKSSLGPRSPLGLAGRILLLLSIIFASSGGALHGQAPTPCSTPEFRQFDFWVGDWEVRSPEGSVVGYNTIEKTLNGCVIKESYHTPNGYSGESFNIYDASRQRWHQSWVDVGGLLLLLEGGFSEGAMILQGETTGPDGVVKQRIRWNRVDGDPNRVRQLWETSTDGGKSWTVAFDGLYMRTEGKGSL